jgi:hypothetical protein
MSQEESDHLEFEAEMDAFARKVYGALDEARSRMTKEERERADRNAAAILRSASDAGERQQKGA